MMHSQGRKGRDGHGLEGAVTLIYTDLLLKAGEGTGGYRRHLLPLAIPTPLPKPYLIFLACLFQLEPTTSFFFFF